MRRTLPESRGGYRYTGKERDSESGLDNFGARYMSSQYGRFMTPDWSSVPTPVPFADISYPQSFNLYSYIRNNPLSRPDLDGHHTVCDPDAYSKDKNGNLVVHAGACHDVPDTQPQQSQSIFQQIGSWLSRARTSISRTGTSLAAILGMGSHGRPRAGRPFTRAGRQQVIRRNQEMNEGRTVCSSCGRDTSPSQQSQAGVTPQDNETNVDHIYPRSQMGDGDPDTNGQLLCRACNLQKGDSLPDGVVEPTGPVEPIEDPIIIDFLF